MARIIVEHAEVTSVMKSGKGFRAQTEYRKRDGGTVTEKWVVWSDQPITLGDVVNVEGLFSKKDESFVNDKGEDIKYTAVHINNAKITEAPTEARIDAQTDSWLANNASPIDEEAPF